MNRLPSRHRLALLATLALTIGSVDASAQSRLGNMFGRGNRQGTQQVRPNQGQARAQDFQQRMNQFVQTNRLKSFVKHGKPVVATQRNTPMDAYLTLGKNVVEFFIRPGFHHLYARVPYQGADGKVQHKVFSRIGGLDKSDWYASTSERVSVLVELSDNEMTNLRGYLDRAHQNPLAVLGRFEYNGGRPPNASNCTSYITNAPIGEHGESLARVLGVYESGFPQGFLGSLLKSESGKVKAMVVQNPDNNFDNNWDIANALR